MNFITFEGQKIIPSKIVCIGRNYVAHIEELENEMPDQPVIFIKPNSSISAEIFSVPGEVVHYELEIAFIVFAGQIRGMGIGLDLTKRELQAKLKAKGLPWERGKAFDRSAVFSEFVSFSGDLRSLKIELFKNNERVQCGDSRLMLMAPDDFLNEAKTFLTLEDGDLLMSGTPKGVGPINVGDTFYGRLYAGEQLMIEKSWAVK